MTGWVNWFLNMSNENSILYDPNSSKPFISLLQSKEDDYFISVTFDIDSIKQIEDFKYYNGLIQIGNYNINLDKEEISINIDLKKSFNSIYWVINGKYHKSKLNEQIVIEDEENNSKNHYFFDFSLSNIRNNDIKKIKNEFNKKNIKTKLYLRYGIVINNELLINEINEEYNVNIVTQKTNILFVIIIYILSGGRGVG